MAEKEGGIVKKRHVEAMRMAITLLGSTGYMWILQKKVENNFKMASKLVNYDTETHGYVSRSRRELTLWSLVNQITADGPKIHLKSLVGITKTSPEVEGFGTHVEAFAAGQLHV